MCPTGSSLAREKARKSNLRSAFDVLDVDHDGKISHDDLRMFYGGYYFGGAAGTKAAAADDDVIGSMISAADSNRDGFVEYDEFENVLGPKRYEKKWSLMEDVFKAMDKDGDGIVGHEDLKNYLAWAGFDANDDDIKAMIRLGGGGHHDNGSGVSYEGLLKILAL